MFGDALALGLALADLLKREAIAGVLALVAVPADRLDVVELPETFGRQVHRLDFVSHFMGEKVRLTLSPLAPFVLIERFLCGDLRGVSLKSASSAASSPALNVNCQGDSSLALA